MIIENLEVNLFKESSTPTPIKHLNFMKKNDKFTSRAIFFKFVYFCVFSLVNFNINGCAIGAR